MTAPETSPYRIASDARRRCARAGLFVLSVLTAAAVGAAEQAAPPPDSAASPGAAGGSAAPRVTPWLDEVRAQRHAWEERRKAAREAFEARHRAADPWGAAQHGAWENEADRRREARRQQMEADREHLRSLGPVPPPMPPWPEPLDPQKPFSLPPGPGSAPSEPGKGEDAGAQFGESPGGALIYPPGAPPKGPYSPQDWDNLWYYRGY